MNKNYFFDLDGTLARFYEDKDWAEKFTQKGYFRALRPYENFALIVNALAREAPNNVYIITAAPHSTAAMEKRLWVRQHLPEILNKQILVQVIDNFERPVTKSKYVSEKLKRKLQRNDILIDDYNINLYDWQDAGGTAIKAVNEMNNNHTIAPHWYGGCINVQQPQTIRKIQIVL